METRDPMHSGTEQATNSTTASPAEENGGPGPYSSQSYPVNHNELMHYEGSGYSHNPVLYRPVSVIPHPAGHTVRTPRFYASGGMVNDPTVMAYQAQFNLVQQQMVYRNPRSTGHNLPVVYHSHGQVPAAYSLNPNAVQTGYIYHQEQFYGSLPPRNANYRNPSHGIVHHAASPHQIGGSQFSVYVHGCPGMNINPGIMHHANPRANSRPSDFSVPQPRPQQHFPVPDGRARLKHHQHARLYDNSSRFPPAPEAGSRPLSSSHAGLSPEDLARFSRMSLTTPLARIPDEQNPSELQHGHENNIRVLPFEPSAILPTVWTRSTNKQNPSDRGGRTQRNQRNHFNQTSVPNYWKNRKKTASSSHQFSWRKKQPRPSSGQYNLFEGNVYHIRRNDFETTYCHPVGSNCNICNVDLGYALGNTKSKHSLLPDVSVLSCGHAFHSDCFRRIVDDQSADPPCFLCNPGRPRRI